nr:filamentous hemagglutinin N-terminal domain-containing protein [Dulcicalothrix desertica]
MLHKLFLVRLVVRFTQFNIDNGQRVYFANLSGVVNTLMRLTSGQASNILGTLGVDGACYYSNRTLCCTQL